MSPEVRNSDTIAGTSDASKPVEKSHSGAPGAPATHPEVAHPGSALPGSERTGAMTHRQILKAMSGLMLALLVAILSSTIVSNALPRITADLDGSQGQYTWVVTAMLLTSTASTPIWGKLSDLFSKKLLYQLAITIFTLGSVLGGFSQSMTMLIAFRAVQGIGMGGLQALIQVVIAAMVSPRERGRYSGYIGATFAVATVSGPLVGGVIVDTPWLGWRWCFWVTVPIAVTAFLVLGRTLRLPVVKRDVHIDWFGAFFLVGGVSLLLIWVSLAGKQFPWASNATALMVGAGLVCVVAALIVETRVREPIVPLGMFRNPTISLATIATVAVGTAMFGGTVFLGQYFQIARAYTPTEAGLMTLPMVLGLFVASTASGQIVSRYTGRVKPFLLFGGCALVVAMACLSTIDKDTDLVLVECYLGLMGLGVGCLMQNLVLAVQNTVGSRNMGSVTSVVTFFRTLGGSSGVSVLGALLAMRVQGYVSSALGGSSGSSSGGGSLDVESLPTPVRMIVRTAYGEAIGDIFFAAACISVITLVAVLFLKESPLRTTVESKEEQSMAVDNPQRPVDNSVETTLPSLTKVNDSSQVGASQRGSGMWTTSAAGELVDNSVDKSVDEPVEGSHDRRSGALSQQPHIAHTANGVDLEAAMITEGVRGVYGLVRDSQGSPLPGAQLTLTDSAGRQIRRAQSDADGQYRLDTEQPGNYLMIASAERYQPAANRVTVDDAQQRHDVRMVGAGGVTGVVRAGREPVAEATVTLKDVHGEVQSSCMTGAYGRYQFADLISGSYVLTASAPDHQPVTLDVTVEEGEFNTVDIEFDSATRLSGVVTSKAGPVPHARVTLLDSTGSVLSSVDTDEHGTYTFDEVPFGDYTMIATGYPPVASTLRLTDRQAHQDVQLGFPE